jgi:hypothetical protein
VIARKVPSVLAEDSLVEVFGGRIAVDVIRNNPSPVFVAALAGGPFRRSVEFVSGDAAIVPALAAATLAWSRT